MLEVTDIAADLYCSGNNRVVLISDVECDRRGCFTPVFGVNESFPLSALSLRPVLTPKTSHTKNEKSVSSSK